MPVPFLLPKDVHANIDQTLDGRFLAEGFEFGGDVIIRWAFRHEPIRGVNRGRQQARVQNGLLRVSLDDGAAAAVKLDARQQKRLRNNRLEHENRIAGNNAYVESISANGRHAAKGQRVANGASATYIWKIAERTSGNPVADFPFEQGAYSPWCIRDDILILRTMPYWKRSGPNDRPISEPLKLRALTLEKGHEVWSWEIRDTSYQGPIPP